MPLIVKDRVRETSTTTGTGTLTLAGAAVGFETFSASIGNANTTYYAIVGGAEWEVGLGTVAAGTLARTTVLQSSNADALVNFSAGSKDVFCTYAADKAVYLDASGNVGALGTITSGVGTALTGVAKLTANTFTGSQTVTGEFSSASTTGFKNKIIGGDFTVNPWQRGTSFAAIASGAYFADRFHAAYASTAVVTASKATDAPTAAQAGAFTQHCISLAVTTADTAVAIGDIWALRHAVEGLNAASFGLGQAGSRNVTLSFWVKGTKTGVHCVAFKNFAVNRAYIAEYTIVTTNTWEYKRITIPVDTAGTWLYDTSNGLRVDFILMSGSTFNTTANTWAAGDFFATANQVNALDTIGNTFKIALVQLEAGSVATSFDVRDYGRELIMCQRYGQLLVQEKRLNAPSASGTYVDTITFVCSMRATPTQTLVTAGTVVNMNLATISAVTNYAVQSNYVNGATGDAYITNRIYFLSAEL